MELELREQVRDAARRLLKCRLRAFIFSEQLRESGDTDRWGPMLNLEEGSYRPVAEDDWFSVFSKLPLTSEQQQTEFSSIVAEALNQAAIEIVDTLGSPEDHPTFRRLIERYIETFSIDTLLQPKPLHVPVN